MPLMAHHGQDNGRLLIRPAARRLLRTRREAPRQAGAEASCNPAP
ncbi:hypothetical protein EKH55_3474 [Sinorhizobium alkalisoli]|nr:hypothetical protein EKH55_3474 [Sinorhizobium alkalisoli]